MTGPIDGPVVFPGADAKGRFRATTTDGALLANIRTRAFSRRFEATAADGTPLCHGAPQRGRRRYVVTAADGRHLLSVRASLRTTKRQVAQLADGRLLTLAPTGWGTFAWAATDAEGATALTVHRVEAGAASTTSSRTPQPRAGRRCWSSAWYSPAEPITTRVGSPTC